MTERGRDSFGVGRGCWTFDGGSWREGATVPLTDRGFRYGMSVFESLAIWRGRVLFVEEHLLRLRRAAEAAGFSLPERLDFPRSWDLEAGTARLYVTAGDGAFSAPAEENRIFAFVEETHFPTREDRARGLRIGLYRAPLGAVLGGWKTGNYWPHVQALGEALGEGLDENLLFNAAGGLVSAAMANVFFWREGRWQTPALESGARDGVVRDWVRRREPVVETVFSSEDVFSVQACVLTNSRLGVMPVREIEGRLLPEPEPAQALAARYDAEVVPD